MIRHLTFFYIINTTVALTVYGNHYILDKIERLLTGARDFVRSLAAGARGLSDNC